MQVIVLPRCRIVETGGEAIAVPCNVSQGAQLALDKHLEWDIRSALRSCGASPWRSASFALPPSSKAFMRVRFKETRRRQMRSSSRIAYIGWRTPALR